MTPNLSDAWRFSAWVRVWLGEPDVAIDNFARAMRLNPRDSLSYSLETPQPNTMVAVGSTVELTVSNLNPP
jgi:hypothetical protein